MVLNFYEFPLIKTTATGNDFIIADLLKTEMARLWARELGDRPRADLARLWCDRTEGLGADGLVILEPAHGLDFAWDFFNSDGSRAEMCGNAARAVSVYMQAAHGLTSLTFKTGAGVVKSEVLAPGEVRVEMPPTGAQEEFADFEFVHAGVPHAVVHVADLSDHATLAERAHAIKAEPRFAKDGTNVTFVRTLSTTHIETLTHERGVDGFTKSCGTGAVAAARSIVKTKEGLELTVDVPGGRLFVVWKQGRPYLRGPARVTGQMRWARELSQ